MKGKDGYGNLFKSSFLSLQESIANVCQTYKIGRQEKKAFIQEFNFSYGDKERAFMCCETELQIPLQVLILICYHFLGFTQIIPHIKAIASPVSV